MRILFANHTSAWSGAEVSLMRVVKALRDDHDVCVACPAEGPLPDAVDAARVERLPLPPIDASLRLHPLQTPLGVARLVGGGVALARMARRFRPQVIHANTPRTGIMAAVARRLGGPRFVVRAHEHLPLTPTGRAVRSLIVRTASAVVAVSDFTAEKFNEGLPRAAATRVYNSIDHARFDRDRVQPARLRDELGLAPAAALIGQVSQITPWKGQDVSVRALAELRGSGFDAQLVLVGDVLFGGSQVRYDNAAFLRELTRLADELGVGDAVHFLGQRDDVPAILRGLDISLLPSWEEPFGLVTVESMAVGTPPLMSADGAGPELVTDGVSGRLLPPGRPDAWARAVRELLDDRGVLRRLGEQGPAAAAAFRDDVHASQMLAIYRQAAALHSHEGPPYRAEVPWPG